MCSHTHTKRGICPRSAESGDGNRRSREDEFGPVENQDCVTDVRILSTGNSIYICVRVCVCVCCCVTCPEKGGRLPDHATWPALSCLEIWARFWLDEPDGWMSLTPGTWMTDELWAQKCSSKHTHTHTQAGGIDVCVTDNTAGIKLNKKIN